MFLELNAAEAVIASWPQALQDPSCSHVVLGVIESFADFGCCQFGCYIQPACAKGFSVNPNIHSHCMSKRLCCTAPSLHALPLVRRSRTCRKGSARCRLTRPAPHQCLDPASKGYARPAPPPLEPPCGKKSPTVSHARAVMRLQAAVSINTCSLQRNYIKVLLL